jgi:hypothetical protein
VIHAAAANQHVPAVALHCCLQDVEQAAVQHLQALFNMPAADSSTDGPDARFGASFQPPSNNSSSGSSQFLTPVWMSNHDMQQLVADQPRSSAANGSTQLCSGAGAATWHSQLTLPYKWAAQPVTGFFNTTMNPYDVDSINNHSTAATPVNSSSSSSMLVDVVDYSGSTQMYLQLDPLCSQGVLFEDSQDFSGPGAATAVAAERDEAYATMR